MLSNFINKYVTYVLSVLLVLSLSVNLFNSCQDSRTGTPLPSVDASVPKHDVTPDKPIKALDKKAIAKVADVPAAIVKDEEKEILATGQYLGDSGSTTVAAVLDKPSGETALIEKRPFAELMNRHELGIQAGITDIGIGKGAYYESTLFRIADFYGGVTAEALQFDSGASRWSVMARIAWRW